MTHYQVERKEVGKPHWTVVQSFCRDLECDVQGLIENHDYEFRVAACNETGLSTYLNGDGPVTARLPFGIITASRRALRFL